MTSFKLLAEAAIYGKSFCDDKYKLYEVQREEGKSQNGPDNQLQRRKREPNWHTRNRVTYLLMETRQWCMQPDKTILVSLNMYGECIRSTVFSALYDPDLANIYPRNKTEVDTRSYTCGVHPCFHGDHQYMFTVDHPTIYSWLSHFKDEEVKKVQKVATECFERMTDMIVNESGLTILTLPYLSLHRLVASYLVDLIYVKPWWQR